MTRLATTKAGLLGAAMAFSATGAAAEGVKIGLIYTLSGPPAVLGEQARDGFLLALDDLGGKLGGLEAEVTVVDDELKPDQAVNKARELVERDDVDFVVGPIFSNILQAIMKPVTDDDTIRSARTPAPPTSPAPNATRTFLSPLIRTIRTTKCWANMPRIRATSACS